MFPLFNNPAVYASLGCNINAEKIDYRLFLMYGLKSFSSYTLAHGTRSKKHRAFNFVRLADFPVTFRSDRGAVSLTFFVYTISHVTNGPISILFVASLAAICIVKTKCKHRVFIYKQKAVRHIRNARVESRPYTWYF